MAHAGVLDVIERLLKNTDSLGQLPAWTVLLDFEMAAAKMARVSPKRIRHWFRVARRAAGAPMPSGDTPQLQGWAVDTCLQHNETTYKMPTTAAKRKTLAALRLVIGDVLEQNACAAATLVMPEAERRPTSLKARAEAAKLFQDSFCAAVFTSAHCDFLEACHAGIAEARAPNIHTHPNSLCETDLTGFLERRGHLGSVQKGPAALIALLVRAITPTTRGWDTALATALKTSAGSRILCTRALIISATGMHSSLHPQCRLKWNQRMIIKRTLTSALGSVSSKGGSLDVDTLCSCAVAVKEAVRRSLAQTLAVNEAARDALLATESWVSGLAIPPHSFPSTTMQQSSIAFATTGLKIANGALPTDCLQQMQLFYSEASNGSVMRRPPLKPPPCPPVKKAIVELSDECFRIAFAPIWTLFHLRGIRMSRLGPTLQRTLCMRDASRALAATLTDKESLRIQRLALQDINASLLPLEAVAAQVGARKIQKPVTDIGADDLPSEAKQLLFEYSADDAARIMRYAMTAKFSESMLIVDLGNDTRRTQGIALLRRMMVEVDDNATLDEVSAKCALLPEVLKGIVCCTECNRVANAYVDCRPNVLRGPSNFNEIGISSSMAFYQPDCNGTPCYLCARRASASVRSSQIKEQQMEHLTNLDDVLNLSDVETVFSNSLPQAAAARLRRDARVCQLQRHSSITCGRQPMAIIPVLGRAVRVLNKWWTMCSLCGVLVRWYPGSSFGTDPCCMYCDTTLVYAKEQLTPAPTQRTLCRYCGKPSDVSSGAAHRSYRSPLDISGSNATLPPPLRRVSFCAAHQRTWLTAALRQLSSAVILSHISHAARPTLSADGGRKALGLAQEAGDDDPVVAAPKRKRAARRFQRKRVKAKMSR